jgi:cellulose biosynthesis protein BcsQ
VTLDDYRASLLRCVERHRDDYDYIFLDAQAGSDEFAQIAINPRISDRVIIVCEYDPMSAAGVERLKALFPDELGYRRTWVLLNKMLPEFVKSFRDFMEISRYLSPVPWTADVVRAYARRELALDLDEGNEFTVAIVQTLRTLLESGEREELERWLDEHTYELRRPVSKQLEELDAELDARRRERARLRRATALRSAMAFVIAVAAGVGANVAVSASSMWLRIAGFAAIPVVLGFEVIVERFLGRLEAVQENDRAIRELESQRVRLSVFRDMELEELLRTKG